jgi:hypothetical protein
MAGEFINIIPQITPNQKLNFPDDAGGEYETLADLHKDDIFGAGKED